MPFQIAMNKSCSSTKKLCFFVVPSKALYESLGEAQGGSITKISVDFYSLEETGDVIVKVG